LHVSTKHVGYLFFRANIAFTIQPFDHCSLELKQPELSTLTMGPDLPLTFSVGPQVVHNRKAANRHWHSMKSLGQSFAAAATAVSPQVDLTILLHPKS